MKKLTSVIIILIGFCCFESQAQDSITSDHFSKHRFSIHGNTFLHTIKTYNVSEKLDKVSSPPALGYNFSLGYQYFFSHKQGINFQLGHGNFQKSYYFAMDQINYEGLGSSIDYYSRPNIEYVSHGKIGYMYVFSPNNSFQFGLSGGFFFRNYWMYGFLTLTDYGVIALQNENEEVIGSTRFFDFEADIHGMTHVNPYVECRFEYHDKHKNVFGIQLEAVIPFRNIYSGEVLIFPDVPAYTSRFDLRYRGGSIGLGLYFAFSKGDVR